MRSWFALLMALAFPLVAVLNRRTGVQTTRALDVPRAFSVPQTILIVEDEQAIADAIRYSLVREGYEVDVVADGESAVAADVERYDMVLLDLMLPKLPGYEVCRRIRERSVVPIVMLSARIAEADRVLGLEVGADDYVSKPFSMPELVGRVRAILRRREMDRGEARATLRVGGLELDLVDRTARVDGREIELTPTELRLLALLAGEPGRPFTRREIVQHIWRSTHVGDQRTCDVHVKNVRQKLERDPARPDLLVTVRGVGYMLRQG
jgi:two-component system response regulator RegX3